MRQRYQQEHPKRRRQQTRQILQLHRLQLRIQP